MTVQPTIHGVNLIDVMDNDMKEKHVSGLIVWRALKWKALLSEFISTALLLFLGCMACVPSSGSNITPMYSTFGFAFIVLFNVTSFAHISGAHMNPSVSLSAVFYGTLSIPLAIGYIIAQCAGASAGYGLLFFVSPVDLVQDSICLTKIHPNYSVYQAFVIEIILSAALGFLNCAVWDPVNREKNDGIPMKYGFTIAGLSLAGGPLTGASMNPARSLGPAIWTGNWNAHWVYWAGPLLGGPLIAICYKMIWLEDQKKIKLNL